MKRIISITSIFLTLMFAGCSEWLDINDDPNYTKDTDKSLIVPSVQLNMASYVGYEMALVGTFWSQYVTQNKNTNQYYTIMQYNLPVSSSYFSAPWSDIYSKILPSLKEIERRCEGVSGAENYIFQAKIMLAYNLYMLTSLYDKVAYSDSYLKAEENLAPKFDDGRTIYASIIALLESIRQMDMSAVVAAENSNGTEASDMILGGDVDGWLQFANTLYLKLLLRDFENNETKIATLLAEDNFLTQDVCFDNFQNQADKSNPLYESDRRQLNTSANIRSCTDILGVLSESDPRLSFYYVGGVTGGPYGIVETPSNSSLFNIEATDPVYFATVDESEFLKAEAYARLSDAVNAKICYEAGITASFARCGCEGADALIATDYAFDSSATVEGMVEQIINHKWASNVKSLPMESWFDMNRTGYPEKGKTITNYEGVIGGYPYRFLYPDISAKYNPNSPEFEPLTSKMWWHK